nr:integrase, catalytic region, zinc finger, CCHC-type, peptidase aspartic, catalytic [Tanacetum cinerariifolium]
MATLADKAILSGADNRPPMLDKEMYDSWKSIMELYMLNRQHGHIILESVKNGPLIWPSIEENRVTRPKKYSELSPTKAIQANCDIRATNIILQGLPYEERECKLYDEFDKFAYKRRETLREFYLRFSLLLNDMNIHNMKPEQFQVNTKFLNTLPPEWSKFVTNVKLVRDLHTTNIDQLYAYLGQHEFHANEDDSWFKDKVLLVQAQANGQILHEEELAFLADPRIAEAQATKTVITHNATYQVDDLDAYDSYCDKINTAKVALMANLFHYGSGDLAKVHNHDNVNHNVINQDVQAMPCSEQSNIMNHLETEITSDSNIISYSQYKAQQMEPKLYDGNVIEKTNAIVIRDSEETLMLAEESRSEMLLKQKDPKMLEKKNSMNSPEPTHSSIPTKVEVPKALPKVSMVNTSLKKLKHHLASFDEVVQIVLWYLDSDCSNHMTGDRSQLTNCVNKFLGTVKFGNDHVEKIMGYVDYQIRNVTISRVYFVEGLGHNLFSVGQFCDSDLEVSFCQHTCFIHNLKGVDLLTESQGNNLYTLSLGDMKASSPICLLSKASKTKSWLWHRRLSHLNFGANNHLARQCLVWGLLKLKFEKDHLCSACTMGKSKKKSHKPKSEETNQEKRYLLHMDLYGPMHVESINGKKYILVIVDDYSRFTWVKCLRLASLMKHLLLALYSKTVPLKDSLPHVTPKIGPSYVFVIGKTPYEVLHNKLPDLSFFHVFGALYYPTNDSENLEKLQPKADIGIFIGYAPTKKAFWIYNRRTRRIIETIHVDFDELTAMAFEHSSSGPALHEMTPTTISSGLVPNPPSSTPFVPPSRTDWDILFQPLFDELLTPPPSVDHPAPEVIAPISEVVSPDVVASTGSPSSTTVDQDAPSPSNSQSTPKTQPPVIPTHVEEDNHDIEVAYMGNDPYFGIPIPEVPSDQSSSLDIIHTIVQPDHQISEHNSK